MNKELNKEQYKEFDEKLALKVMVLYYSDIYNNLFNSDKPDIQSSTSDVGIEVTTAEKQELLEIKSHVNSVLNKTKNELTKNDIRNIENGEIESILYYKNKIVAAGPPAYWGSDFDFCTIINKKLLKLNSDSYKRYKTNCLFIYANNLDRFDISVDRTFEVLKSIDYRKYNVCFDIIYIFTWHNIIEYHISEDRFVMKNVDKDTIFDLAVKIREEIVSKSAN